MDALPEELVLTASDEADAKLILWGAEIRDGLVVCMDYFASRPFVRGQIFDSDNLILATPIEFDPKQNFAGFFCPGLMMNITKEAVVVKGIALERYVSV